MNDCFLNGLQTIPGFEHDTSHVNGFMRVTERPEDAQWVIDTLDSKYELKFFDDIKYFLGMNIEMTESEIHFQQVDYMKELVDSFRLTSAQSKATSGF